MAISESRISQSAKTRILNHLEPIVKSSLAAQLGKDVKDLKKSEYSDFLNSMVNANTDLNNILIEEIVKEITDNGLVTVKILPGVVGVGVGSASTLNVNTIKVTGKIK